MSEAAQELVLRELRRRAAGAGLRLVKRGSGWALLIRGNAGAIVGKPLPVPDLAAAAGVICASLQTRAELGALAATLAAKHRAKRGAQ